jgi:3-methyladenine DNA glycosylase/8-oxoguanine DNA glycosylase
MRYKQMVQSDHKCELFVEGPLDLYGTLGTGYGSGDPTTYKEDSTLWRTYRTSAGPATLHVRADPTDGGSQVSAQAWGDGADAILGKLPDLLGLHDDASDFAPQTGLLRDLNKQHAGMRIGRGKDMIDSLVPHILGQRVTTGEAHGSYHHMLHALGERAPGPRKLQLPVDPRVIGRRPPHALARFGVDHARARTLVEVCSRASALRRAHSMPAEEAERFIRKLRGIGAWTANLTIAETHGWADAVPTGDYHMPNAIAWALAGEPRADDARMLELLEPYRGHRWRVIRLIGTAHIKAPRRGPRRASWQTNVDLATARHEKKR